jgi:hypothetical protein
MYTIDRTKKTLVNSLQSPCGGKIYKNPSSKEPPNRHRTVVSSLNMENLGALKFKDFR